MEFNQTNEGCKSVTNAISTDGPVVQNVEYGKEFETYLAERQREIEMYARVRIKPKRSFPYRKLLSLASRIASMVMLVVALNSTGIPQLQADVVAIFCWMIAIDTK